MALFKKTQSLNLKNFKDEAKLTLSTISGAFMLPIATMAITGLFLTLGTFFEINNRKSEWLFQVGKAIKAIAFPILHALPLLFCVAFAIKFAKNDPLAVWSAIIAYLVFTYVQSAFISTTTSSSSTSGSSHKDLTFTALFTGSGRDKPMKFLVHKLFGVYTLNTSIIGSLLIGGIIIPFVFKHFSNVEFPKYLAYFSGKRFLPLASALAMVPLALLFLLLWPWVGFGMSSFGAWFGKTPYGIDSFIFGFLEKSLIPTGLHHIFASSFWYTSLGGDVSQAILSNTANLGSSSITAASVILPNDANATSAMTQIFYSAVAPFTSWQGDSFIGLSALSLPGNKIDNLYVFDYLSQKANLNVGRFTQGKFPIMQFGLPAAGLAMICAAPKANRKVAIAQIAPAILTSFIIGITEPMEFSFLFIAPKLFYGFHAVMCGFSFMAMNLLGAHIPTVFSGGVVELFLYGIMLFSKGTHFWWYLVVGSVLAPIYFSVFYYSIVKFDLLTPGRGVIAAEEVKADESAETEIPLKIKNLALGFGGWENLEQMACCASRLRYDIVDKEKVNEALLKTAGVIAIKFIGDKHVHAILGPQAETINNQMLKWQGTELKI